MSSHSDVAAYMLGVLDEGAELAFDDHLSGCARCQCELVEFQAIPVVLTQAEQFGLLARQIPVPAVSKKRRFGGGGVPVRGLLLIAASLLLMAVVAVLAISGVLPADNHLSHASSVPQPWV
jgi:putative zinc finger protein